MQFSDLLRSELARRRWDGADLARLSGLRLTRVEEILAGDYMLIRETQALAGALSVHPGVLAFLQADMPKIVEEG